MHLRLTALAILVFLVSMTSVFAETQMECEVRTRLNNQDILKVFPDRIPNKVSTFLSDTYSYPPSHYSIDFAFNPIPDQERLTGTENTHWIELKIRIEKGDYFGDQVLRTQVDVRKPFLFDIKKDVFFGIILSCRPV